jgi:hypothetical protein
VLGAGHYLVNVRNLFPEIANRFKHSNRQISKGIDSNKLLFKKSTTREQQERRAMGKATSLLDWREMTVRALARPEGMWLGRDWIPGGGKNISKKNSFQEKTFSLFSFLFSLFSSLFSLIRLAKFLKI